MTGPVQLAKKAMVEYVKNGKKTEIPVDIEPGLLSGKAGIFVTIRKEGQLRGCIGTYSPTKQNIAEEILANSISACSIDPRFSPVEEAELPELSIEVSIMEKPEILTDAKKHNPQESGIIVVAADGRKGLLLPGIEGVDTLEMQVQIASEKARIDPQQKELKFYSFKTKVHR